MYLLLLITFSSLRVSCGNLWREKQSALIKNLTEKLDTRVDPALNSSAHINVAIEYGIYVINGIDEREQVLKAIIFITVEWHDPDLTWSLDDGNPRRITVPSKDVWTPDLFILNEVEDKSVLDVEKGKSSIMNDGRIFTSMYRRTSTTCTINAARFPFDTQICYIILSPRDPLSNFRLVIDHKVNMQLADHNHEWYIVNVSARNDYKTTEKGYVYPGALAKIVLRRRALFHVLKSVIPSVLMSFINLFVFWMPVESGERMSMAISAFLSYTIYVTYIYDSLPANSDTVAYFPVYLCWLMIQSGFIIAVTTVSLHFYHQRKKPEDNNKPETQIPKQDTTCNESPRLRLKILSKDNKVRPFNSVNKCSATFCRRFDTTCFSIFLVLSSIAILWLLYLLLS